MIEALKRSFYRGYEDTWSSNLYGNIARTIFTFSALEDKQIIPYLLLDDETCNRALQFALQGCFRSLVQNDRENIDEFTVNA